MHIGTPSDSGVTTASIAANAVTGAKLNTDVISAQTALGAEPADTDEFLVSDAGVLKRVDYSYIKGGGITEADNWRLNANLSGDHEPIASSNFERVDNTGYSKIGTGMSYDSSSGLFTFGATGLYYVVWNWGVQLDSSSDASMITYLQANISGSVTNLAQGKLSGDLSNNQHQMITISALYNVTNVSTHKLQINVNSMNNNDTVGDSGYTRSGITFIRLGDSQ